MRIEFAAVYLGDIEGKAHFQTLPRLARARQVRGHEGHEGQAHVSSCLPKHSRTGAGSNVPRSSR